MTEEQQAAIDDIAASNRLLRHYVGEFGKPSAVPPEFAALRVVALVGDMVEDLAMLVAGLLAAQGQGDGPGHRRR